MTDADSNKGGDTSEIDMEDSNSGGADPGGRCSSKNDIDIGGDTEGGALGGGAAKSRSKPAVKRRLPGSTGKFDEGEQLCRLVLYCRCCF